VRVLTEASDLSDFWYREHYLEMTRCIQFPIEMSLPWILTEHLLLKHVSNAPLLEGVLFLLDTYNDAAQRALYVLNQQFLYDEIEAEANLVIDQVYFLLSDEVYAHYKNLAAASQLDMALKSKLELLKGHAHLTVEARRYEALLSQRHIQLLGRSVNFAFILGQNINNRIYRDIDFAVKRFEASDARAVVELRTLLDVIRGTHARLAQFLALDSFETMLRCAA
jgi:cytoplasmic FMR1 interacting protein